MDDCDACPVDQIEAILENKRLGSNRFVLISLKDLYRLHELTTFILNEEECFQALQDCKRIWSVFAQIRIPRKDSAFLVKYVSLLLDVAGYLGLHMETDEQSEEYRRHMWEILHTIFEKVILLSSRFWLAGNEPVFMRIIFSIATIYSLFKDVATEDVICKCYELSCDAMLIGDMSLTESEWQETSDYCENIENVFVLRRRMEDCDQEEDVPETTECEELDDDLYHHYEGANYDFTELNDPLEEEMFIESFARETIAESVHMASCKITAVEVVAEQLSKEIVAEALATGHSASLNHFYDTDVPSSVDESDDFYENSSPGSSSSAVPPENHDDLYHREPQHQMRNHKVYDARSDFEKRFGIKRLKDAPPQLPTIVAKPENFVSNYRRQPMFNFHSIAKERSRPDFGLPWKSILPQLQKIPTILVDTVSSDSDSDAV